MDTQRIRELLDQRDALDEEIKALVNGTKERKPQKCGTCQQEGHSSRTCPQKGDSKP
jgi:hypothetical protein